MMRVAATELNPLSKYIFAAGTSEQTALTDANGAECLADPLLTYN
jgi:hypothetical protein